jgi:hypothetical protein
MHFRLLYEGDDETPVLEMDEEAIEYLIEGLEQLRGAESGDTLTSPALVFEGDEPLGVGTFELRRK